MSRMSDIHAAASEIDTTDADAVRQLADELAAEHYAPKIAIRAAAIIGIITGADDGEPVACGECGVYPGDDRVMPDGRAICHECHAIHAGRVTESMGTDCLVCECRPGAVCDHECHA